MKLPSYFKLYNSGELKKRAEILHDILKSCKLCPHKCKVNRIDGQKGRCRSTAEPYVASHNAHFGEEPPISGSRGSGTIFFANCTLKCVFCQNYPISQMGNGRKVSNDELAEMFLNLQKRGCHNINFVTPTHYLSSIIDALLIAIGKGFNLPIVYNTSGYENVEILQLLDGIVDIYLPDIKYADDETAMRLSGAENYVAINRAALKEMFRQVGYLQCDEGIAVKGMIIRHLVLPNNFAGTEEAIKFIAEELSPEVHFGLMSQYFPAHLAVNMDEINRRVKPLEYKPLIKLLGKYNMNNGWTQPL